jgi:hypothetical protein
MAQCAITALRQQGDSYKTIAAKTGISANAVTAVLKNPKVQEKVANLPLTEAYIKGISGNWFRRMSDALDTVDQDKLDKMSAYQLYGMAGIAHQNARLANEQSTANISLAAQVHQSMKSEVIDDTCFDE